MDKIIPAATEMADITADETSWLHKIKDGMPVEKMDMDVVSRIYLKLFATLTSAMEPLINTLRPLTDNSDFAVVFGNVASLPQMKSLWNMRSTTTSPSSGDQLLHILCCILSVSKNEGHMEVTKAILDHCLNTLMQTSQVPNQPVHALSILLKNREVREIFLERHCVQLLANRVVGASVEVQLLYELGVCMWLLSFSPEGSRQLVEARAVAKLHDTLKSFKKEKCARISLQCLSNLCKIQDQEDEGNYASLAEGERRINIYSEMLSLGLLRTLEVMARRSFADPDITTLVDSLVEKLEQRIEDVSSFADYRQEVMSGRLEWSPVHKSERFWKENMKEFEAENYAILRELSNILNVATEPTPICVALHDFGEFVRFHPQGRKVVNALPVKAKIIQLLDSSNEEIKKEALMCTQKLLVKNWEFLGA